MGLIDELTPQAIARVRELYEEGDATVAAIALAEGLSERQVQELRRRFGWPSRRAARKTATAKSAHKSAHKRADKIAAKSAGEASGAKIGSGRRTASAESKSEPPRKDAPSADLVKRLRALLEAEIDGANERLAGEKPEAAARTLGALTRALQTLKAIESGEKQSGADTADDRPPLDLAELRRELARRIDRLREERGAS